MVVFIGEQFDIGAEQALQGIEDQRLSSRFHIDGIAREDFGETADIRRGARLGFFPEDRFAHGLDMVVGHLIEALD